MNIIPGSGGWGSVRVNLIDVVKHFEQQGLFLEKIEDGTS